MSIDFLTCFDTIDRRWVVTGDEVKIDRNHEVWVLDRLKVGIICVRRLRPDSELPRLHQHVQEIMKASTYIAHLCRYAPKLLTM